MLRRAELLRRKELLLTPPSPPLPTSQEMRERGVNVVTISGSSAGGLGSQEAIREVERIRSREGNVTILAVIDSFMHLFVNKMVTLYIERKWLTRIFEDEVQDNPCQVGIRGGGGGGGVRSKSMESGPGPMG